MKTNPTATVKQTSRWRGLRHWITTTTLLSFVSMTTVLRAQVTNIIYQDSFARTGLLNGSMPDTVDANGATWIAWQQIVTDGSEAAVTNFNPGQSPFNDAYLPFTAETGHVYTVTASLLANTNYGNNWLAFGYATCPSLNQSYSGGSAGMGWLLHRSTNVVGSANGTSGNFQTFRGPGTGTPSTFSFLDTSFTTNFTTYSIVLNTATNPMLWSVTFYTNGGFVTSSTYPAPGPKGNFNVPMGYVGFGANTCAGWIKNFSLTDVVPVPTLPTILEQPQNVTAQVGHTATFWVNAVGLPDPNYQWLSNNVAIAGATNATYTTPTLSLASYNNVNYSVTVSNAAGLITAGPATLTVAAAQPTVYSATKTGSGTGVVVMFSSPIDPTTGLDTANYSLNNGASVLSASYGSAQSNSVILTTSTMNPNLGYYVSVSNVQDQFSETMTGASVPVLPAGLALYLRGDSGVVFDTNNLVVEWLDQTTNGNNVVQYFGERQPDAPIPGPQARPTLGIISPNNLPALQFTGANTNFLTAAPTPSLAINSNLTIVALANFASFGSGHNQEFINKTIGNQPGSFDFYANNANGVGLLYNGNAADGGPFVGGTINPTPGNTHEWLVTRAAVGTATNGNVTNVVLNYQDGSSSWTVGTTTNAIVGPPGGCVDAGEPLYVGGRSDHYVNNIANGQIAEIMLFNAAISDPDRTNIDNYLGQKYFTFAGFTPDLPASTTSSNGFAVTYTILASQGPTHFAYQWQEDGTNIPGAIGTSYTTAILGPGDNGETFDVAVTLPNGSIIYSTTNTLTVLSVPPYVAFAGIPIWSSSNIVVLFDEAVNPATATIAANYSLNNGASVLSAVMADAPNKVVLTTSALTWSANPGFYSLTVSNVQDLYGNTITNASSSVGLYPLNTAIWIRADTGVTTDAGTNSVNQWNDLSGNNNNFFQGGGVGLEPTLVTNALGDPVIRFGAGATTTNAMVAFTSPTLGITGDMSVVAVVNFRTLSAGRSGEIVSKTGSSTHGNIAAPYDCNVGSAASMLRGNGAGSVNGINFGSYTATSGPFLGYPVVVAMSESGNLVSHYLDGKAVGAGLLSNGYQETNDFDAGNSTWIGARSDFFNRLTGDLSELIVSGSPLSSYDLAALDNYFATQHHIVLYNPGPTNIVVSFKTNQMTLSWPADHTGWQLQSNSVGLTATDAWFGVSGSTTTNQITFTPDPTQTNVFYRMYFQQP